MGLTARTCTYLIEEEITMLDDLDGFDKSILNQMAVNLRRPGGRMLDLNRNTGRGATMHTPIFILGAKTQLRLNATTEIVNHYGTIRYLLTAGNTQWTVIKNFSKY